MLPGQQEACTRTAAHREFSLTPTLPLLHAPAPLHGPGYRRPVLACNRPTLRLLLTAAQYDPLQQACSHQPTKALCSSPPAHFQTLPLQTCHSLPTATAAAPHSAACLVLTMQTQLLQSRRHSLQLHRAATRSHKRLHSRIFQSLLQNLLRAPPPCSPLCCSVPCNKSRSSTKMAALCMSVMHHALQSTNHSPLTQPLSPAALVPVAPPPTIPPFRLLRGPRQFLLRLLAH